MRRPLGRLSICNRKRSLLSPNDDAAFAGGTFRRLTQMSYPTSIDCLDLLGQTPDIRPYFQANRYVGLNWSRRLIAPENLRRALSRCFANANNEECICVIRRWRLSRLSTAPWRGYGGCGWPELCVFGAAGRRDFGVPKRPRRSVASRRPIEIPASSVLAFAVAGEKSPPDCSGPCVIDVRHRA